MKRPTISSTAAKLAACEHPIDQVQLLMTPDGAELKRCSDCGAVYYAGSVFGWTRPVLVAHVCGAVREAAVG